MALTPYRRTAGRAAVPVVGRRGGRSADTRPVAARALSGPQGRAADRSEELLSRALTCCQMLWCSAGRLPDSSPQFVCRFLSGRPQSHRDGRRCSVAPGGRAAGRVPSRWDVDPIGGLHLRRCEAGSRGVGLAPHQNGVRPRVTLGVQANPEEWEQGLHVVETSSGRVGV